MKISIGALVVAALLQPAASLRRRLVQTSENLVAKKELAKQAQNENQSADISHRLLQGSDSSAAAFYANAGNPMPVQTFYIPLPEMSMFGDMFYVINANKARPPIESMISVAISTDLTQIWYDHWEDGYDKNVVLGHAPTTEIWGDGDASNGCAPSVTYCTNSNDRLMAGDTVVIQNTVELPRIKSNIRYDGSDRIQASFPIAVTRGAYPDQPGSLMAGAVEVLDVDCWGTTFEAPIGMDVGQHMQAFQLTLIYVMAMEEKTRVTLQNGYVLTLNQGEGKALRVNIGHRITSNKPVQATLITGDVWSYYELRWFSLLPVEQFSKEFVSPVGDTFGKTKSLIYNPGPDIATVAVSYRDEATGQQRNIGTRIGPKQATLSPVNPTGSGMWINSTVPILCLSLTDTEVSVANGQVTGGQFYDWGFPMVPRPDLTSQVLIGWGYGCTNNNCYGQEDRSVVWVSPIQDADIYVDLDNKGTDYLKIPIDALASHKFRDEGDHDMSGAVIFATTRDSGADGPTVPIAAAWGQDPSVSYEHQAISLDLGTTIPPMREIHAAKLVSHVEASPDTILTYTIRVMNLGQRELQPNMLSVYDKLGDYLTYVEGSTFFYSETAGIEETTIPDDTSGTKFPLDEDGFSIPVMLPRRGGIMDITFQVRMADLDNITLLPVQNMGHLVLPGGNTLPFKARTKVIFNPSVSIENTAYLGSDSGRNCESEGEEVARGNSGSSVVYCFKVTNTGESYLRDVFIVNDDLGYQSSISGIMAPGESRIIASGGYLEESAVNYANVTAIAVLKDGTVIEDEDPVKDRDESNVELIEHNPAVTIENTIYKAHDASAKCGTDETFEKVEDIFDQAVTHCFKITNSGDTYLTSLDVQNPALGFSKTLSDTLGPGEFVFVSYEGTITASAVNTASVTATSVLETGPWPGSEVVKDSDTAETVKLEFEASVEVKNTVYEGHDDGAKCGTDEASEFVGNFVGTDVTFCFEILNSGEAHLDNIELFNREIGFFETSSIPASMAPGETHLVWVAKELTKTQINYATVTANPTFQDGRDLGDLDDVTDTDPSELAELAAEPAIEVLSTVYQGHDNGGSCGSSKAVESVEDFAGTTVTYCFTLHNTGNTFLSAVEFENSDLDFSSAISTIIPPGGSRTIPFESTISSTLLSELVVNGTPVNEAGDDITGTTVLTGSDTSGVVEVQYNPELSVQNTVYAGDDDGSKCATDGIEYVEGPIGSAATFCFLITNSGNTYLKNLRVKNPLLDFDETLASATPIAPGATVTVTVARSIMGRVQNHVTVSGEPSTSTGEDLPYQDVSGSDPSEVALLALAPGLEVVNTVYVGDDSGNQCQTDVPTDSVEDIFLTDVQYCFTLTNTGETFLKNVAIENGVLEYDNTLSAPLAPGDSINVSVPGKIRTSVENTLVVTATPCWQPEGGVCHTIPDLTETTASDVSSVAKMEFVVGVEIENTAKLGSHDGKCNGLEFVEDKPGADVTYCFEVKNTGSSHLMEIEVAAKDVLFFFTLPELLAPGDSAFVTFPTVIEGSQETFANVTATPASEDGRRILDEEKVKDSDPASVGMLAPNPAISISNKVYLGDDDGASCGSSVAVDEVEDTFGSDVIYCFTVENTGDTTLASLVVTDNDLSFEDSSITSLPAGESATISVPGSILATKSNEAVVTAEPVFDNGVDLDIPSVTASDTSRVKEIAYEPSIYIQTTAYSGDNGETNCDGENDSELAEGFSGYDVTYCFTVFNTGDSYLGSITVTSDDLGFTGSIEGNVPPQESKVLTFKTSIESSVNITASVEGNPTLEDGTDIPSAATVTSADPAGHRELEYSPSIQIDNLVAMRSGGDDACVAARDFVEGPYGQDVSYCFKVTNTGDSYLDSVTINDDDLDFSQTLDGMLEPGQSIVIAYPAEIRGDLRNIATAIANPVSSRGEDITDQTDVEASDDSTVGQFDYVGGVSIANTVYVGQDGGARCGGDAAGELAEGLYETMVTYCFEVKNTGDTYLGDIVVSNDDLVFSDNSITILAPGESAMVSTSGQILDDFENTASVTANPVNREGESIPDLADVTGSDKSSVGKLQFSPSITIENTVYLGSDNGSQCGSSNAVELVSGKLGDIATFCFFVTNTGDSYLDSIIVSDTVLDFTSDPLGRISPGSTATAVYTAPIQGAGTNDAIVTAQPTLIDGTMIPELDSVSDTDPSALDLLPFEPSISIENTVYLGEDGGALCASDTPSELVESTYGNRVTYCFLITNTGDSYLNNVVLENEELSFSNDAIGMLAPGSTATVSYTASISGYLKNFAAVTATPSLPDGTAVPDVDDVTDSDPSAVDETFDNIFGGPTTPDDGPIIPGESGGIPSDPSDPGDGGDIPDPMNPGGGDIPDPFSPGGGDIPDPLNPGGGGIPDPMDPDGGDDPTIPGEGLGTPTSSPVSNPDDNDTPLESPSTPPNAEPSITIENTVYVGDDLGVACPGTELAEDSSGSSVVYCFLVTNTGNTYVHNIVITDPDLNNYFDNSIGTLAPGVSQLVTIQSSITEDLVNTAKTTGQPGSMDGGLYDVSPVEATDPSEVKVAANRDVRFGDKTPFAPPSPDPEGCIQDNFGDNDMLVCAERKVFLETVRADVPDSCVADGSSTITISLEGTIEVASSVNDLGWYIATDGGDAMIGTCVINGLQEGNTYDFEAGSVVWTEGGGDGDECGDVIVDGGQGSSVITPIGVDVTVVCADDNEDGTLDFALCFTWSGDANGDCTITSNTPTESSGSCYCTRYEVPNVDVMLPDGGTTTVC